jgi:hypothetical protein
MAKKTHSAKSVSKAFKGNTLSKEVSTKLEEVSTEEATPAATDEAQDMELVHLLDKYTVEAHFLHDVEGQLFDIYPSLLEEVDYSPAEIVGETFWANLTNLGQRIALLCLKHLATEPDVPLVDVTCSCCGKTSFSIV